MKRIIVAILMALACLVPVSVITAPAAQAYTCVSKSKSVVFDVYGPPLTSAGRWVDTFRMYYRVCDEPNTRVCDATHCYNLFSTTAYVDKLTHAHDSMGTSCGPIDYFGFNPNALGGTWDPVQRTGNCTTTTLNFVWDPSPVRITQGMPSNEECVAITVKEYPGGYSGDTTVSDSICVTYTM